jgi:hypothetical protein
LSTSELRCRIDGCEQPVKLCGLCKDHWEEKLVKTYENQIDDSILEHAIVDDIPIHDRFMLGEWQRLHDHWIRNLRCLSLAKDEKWIVGLKKRELLCKELGLILIYTVRKKREGEDFMAIYHSESSAKWYVLTQLDGLF